MINRVLTYKPLLNPISGDTTVFIIRLLTPLPQSGLAQAEQSLSKANAELKAVKATNAEMVRTVLSQC